MTMATMFSRQNNTLSHAYSLVLENVVPITSANKPISQIIEFENDCNYSNLLKCMPVNLWAERVKNLDAAVDLLLRNSCYYSWARGQIFFCF